MRRGEEGGEGLETKGGTHHFSRTDLLCQLAQPRRASLDCPLVRGPVAVGPGNVAQGLCEIRLGGLEESGIVVHGNLRERWRERETC